MSDEFKYNLANERIEEERQTMIAKASSKLNVIGTEDCTECGLPIPQARRDAAPFATLCITCATLKERG